MRRNQHGACHSLIAETIAVDSVLANLVIQNALSSSQQARGFRAVAPRGFQRIDDDVFFVGSDSLGQRKCSDGSRSLRGLQCRRKMMPVYDGRVANEYRAFENILEFAHVAG